MYWRLKLRAGRDNAALLARFQGEKLKREALDMLPELLRIVAEAKAKNKYLDL